MLTEASQQSYVLLKSNYAIFNSSPVSAQKIMVPWLKKTSEVGMLDFLHSTALLRPSIHAQFTSVWLFPPSATIAV